ncbi:sugar ABC transporter permease [Paenibacillus darwinianus]|uniref:Sugar ABC transporter permease n=1 Tax=Paenibacillus darwinianus TaxID=1380763 RepID=A0A9W5RZZ5_9BACL|nr:carbohydrate ABC transporter permease [Paenibacillus darwinianus]EXX85934.1 sugar ABC transporter permease [Paenibacillus darwinianus]EXX85997.1 sugar ABC transporter permease [Paenibacillus darwinianus]EXX86091.1 sugar ABC transporter permease [Paenibacillus darwinianus]
MVTRNRFSFGTIAVYTALTLFSIASLLPMVLTLMVSFTAENAISQNGYSLFPEAFSLDGYRTIFVNSALIFRGYAVSIFVTAAGSAIALIITALAAYPMSNPNVKYRNFLALYFFITILFNGGLVPWYLMSTKLGLIDNVMALIVPTLMFNAFNMFLVKNFMEGLPEALRESAYLDGANDLRIVFRIYMPLCVPVLATVALFYALAYWNDWFNAIMLVGNKDLYPLQYILFQLRSNIQMLEMLPTGASAEYTLPAESAKMATVIITIGPIAFLYPYLQRYFVKGLVIGSVKG